MTQIASKDNRVFLIARVMIMNDTDIPLVYNLSRQITIAPLGN